MKIAIVSDCHFGFNEDALPQAREALMKALELGADAILLPGDIYDVRVPKQETLHESVALFSEIRKRSGRSAKIRMSEFKDGKEQPLEWEGIPLLAIWGTHERRSRGLANVIQILDAAGLLVSLHTRSIILEKNGQKVAFQALGGVPEEYFRRTLEVGSFSPVRDAYNIFVFHQNLQELLPMKKEEDVAMDELPAGFDLYVNGHIHWNHDLKINGRRLLVAGSTVVTQMKKNEEKGKGLYIFETETKTAEFVKIRSRPFFFREIELENEDAGEVQQKVAEELEKIMKEAHLLKPLIKIKLSGTVKKDALVSLNLESVVKKYSENSLVFIDKEFGSENLKEKIEKIRRIRSEGKGAKELGLEILKEKMREKGLKSEHAQELLELFSEGNVEEALKLI